MRVTVATMKPPDRPLLPTSPSDIPSAAGEAHASRRALRMLSACNRALTRVDDEIALLSEICRIVNMPVNTVKSHLHRALQSLRKKLEKHL